MDNSLVENETEKSNVYTISASRAEITQVISTPAPGWARAPRGLRARGKLILVHEHQCLGRQIPRQLL